MQAGADKKAGIPPTNGSYKFNSGWGSLCLGGTPFSFEAGSRRSYSGIDRHHRCASRQVHRELRGHTMKALSLAVVTTALLLEACGGGDNGSTAGPPPPPTSYSLATAMAGFITNGELVNVIATGSVAVNGVLTPLSGSGTLDISPAAIDSFYATPALSTSRTVTGTATVAGHTGNLSGNKVVFYDAGNFAYLGELNVDASNGEFDIAAAPIMLPEIVTVGSSGALGTINRYTDTSMSVPIGTFDYSYQVKSSPGTATTVVVEFTYRMYDLQHNLAQTAMDDFALSSAGVLSFLSATSTDGAQWITLTAQ
jgi:hypothetical protein